MDQFQTLYTNFHPFEGLLTIPWIAIACVLSVVAAIIVGTLISEKSDEETLMSILIMAVCSVAIVVGIGAMNQSESMNKLTTELNGVTIIPLSNINAANKNHPIINNTMIVTDATETKFTATNKHKEDFNNKSAEFTITKDEIIPENEYAEFMLKSEKELAKLDLDIDESSIKQESNYEFTAKTTTGQDIVISNNNQNSNNNKTIYINIQQ